MYKILFIVFIFLFSHLSFSQKFLKPSDSLCKKRIIIVTSSLSFFSVSSLLSLQNVWYKGYTKSKLHSFNDSKNWLGMDKLGHVYTCYNLSRISSSLFKWSGLSKNKSIIIGSSFAWSYQFVLELMDGKSSAWGFSWADLLSNTAGSLFYSSQELLFDRQIFQLKFSYYPSPYSKYRPDVLGKTWNERLLKDYNGQTYWLSFSPFEFFKSKKMKFLQISLGYSIDSRLIGDKNIYIDKTGKSFYSKQEYLLSFDLRLNKLPIKNKIIKAILSPFDLIKIPLPGVLWRNKVCYLGLY